MTIPLSIHDHTPPVAHYGSQSCSTTSTTSFSWNTASSIPEMIGVNGYAYIYAGGLPTEQIGPNGSVLYYLQDRQGSTVALTDQQGNVVARYSYSPYGTLTCGPNTPPNTQPNQPLCHPAPPTPPAACPPPSQHSPAGPPPCLSRAIAANHFLYDGQYLDTISGLYYLRARWYDPATGQFISVDALVALTGEPYSYAGGNPVNGSDSLGLLSANWVDMLVLKGLLGYSNKQIAHLPTFTQVTTGIWVYTPVVLLQQWSFPTSCILWFCGQSNPNGHQMVANFVALSLLMLATNVYGVALNSSFQANYQTWLQNHILNFTQFFANNTTVSCALGGVYAAGEDVFDPVFSDNTLNYIANNAAFFGGGTGVATAISMGEAIDTVGELADPLLEATIVMGG